VLVKIVFVIDVNVNKCRCAFNETFYTKLVLARVVTIYVSSLLAVKFYVHFDALDHDAPALGRIVQRLLHNKMQQQL